MLNVAVVITCCCCFLYCCFDLAYLHWFLKVQFRLCTFICLIWLFMLLEVVTHVHKFVY
jgi:hypothetical protein